MVRWVDRYRSGKTEGRPIGIAEIVRDGGAAVRRRMARLRVWGVRRPHQRDGDDGRAEQEVAARIRSAVQPGNCLSWYGRSRALAELPRTGVRRPFAISVYAQNGSDFRSAAKRAAFHRAA